MHTESNRSTNFDRSSNDSQENGPGFSTSLDFRHRSKNTDGSPYELQAFCPGAIKRIRNKTTPTRGMNAINTAHPPQPRS